MGETGNASGLQQRLKAEAERARAELAATAGLGRSTYDRLVTQADEITAKLSHSGFPESSLDPIRARRRVLKSVVRLIDDPKAQEIAPSNTEAYAAAIDIAELARVVATLANAGTRWRAALAEALAADAEGRDDAGHWRLTLAFGALCRRGRLEVAPEPGGAACTIELDRWEVRCPSIVPTGTGWPTAARSVIERAARPTIVVLEAGPLLPTAHAVRVADDQTALSVAGNRVDAFLAEHRDAWADAIGTELAFALVARATVPAVNVASGRVVLAECFRCVNLCSVDDPRAMRLRRFMDAIAKA